MFDNYLLWLPDLTHSSAINRAQLISAIASESMISRAELYSVFPVFIYVCDVIRGP